jgi:regulator of sigma D
MSRLEEQMKKRVLKNIFCDEVFMYWDCTAEETKKYLQRKYPQYKANTEYFLAYTDYVRLEDKSRHFFICLPRGDRQDQRVLIIHEVVHLTSMVFQYVGIPHTKATDEVWAYQVQDFCRQIFDILNLRW